MKDQDLKYLLGFTISRTIDVERSIIYFITRYYCNDPKLKYEFYDLISEYTFNKKIEVFNKIIKKPELKLSYSIELVPNIEKIRKIRNHFAHESFSFDGEEKKYCFVNLKGRLIFYSQEEIESHWAICRKVEKEITGLCVQLN